MLGSLAICFLVVTHNFKNPKSIVLCHWSQDSSKAYWCINEKKKSPVLLLSFLFLWKHLRGFVGCVVLMLGRMFPVVLALA